MLTYVATLVAFATLASGAAQSFPVVGATYQLDRAKYPGRVAICTTAASMTKFIEAETKGDQAGMKRMVVVVTTMADIEKMKKAAACTMISSSSQAKIVQKGIEAHKAECAAFPLEPMWGYYLYFGGRVK